MVLAFLVLFFVRPGAQRIKSRIVSSISLALGRPVEISSARIQLLPHPGFDLEGFVVHDDPAFSAEPMLRAEDVTASLRLWSLLRGHLEISRLSLKDPSLNLVRDASGHWNLEKLLERAAQTSVAPTGKSTTELRPGFPYIEAESGRINLKNGEEKKPYALTDADFALWQDSENSWGLRLEGRPVRTDFNLTNTGTIKLSGTWQRAPSFHETPLQIAFEWSHGQLGQVTTLAYGNDKGWRGELDWATQITGTPDDLKVQTNASIQDFRHYDVTLDSNLPLTTQCNARYNYEEQFLSDISCRAPVQGGFLSVEGNIQSLLGPRNYLLTLVAQDVPMQALTQLVTHVKKDIPQDVFTTGRLNAKATLSTKANIPQWQGQGEIKTFHLVSESTNADFVVNTVPFVIGGQSTNKTRNRAPSLETASAGAGVEIGPWNLPLGSPNPAVVHGWISPSEYAFRIKGDTQLQRLLPLARVLSIPVPQTGAEGTATVDLGLIGSWSNSAVRATGTAQLHSIHAQIRGLNTPLEIATASLSLTPTEISVQKLSASIAGSAWRGTLTLPRPCAIQETCAAHFNLHTDELTEATLDSLLITPPQSDRWYSFLSEKKSPTFLSRLRATGQLSVGNVEIYKLNGSELLANADLEAGSLHFSNVRAKFLGGKHIGNLTVDFNANTPTIHATGTFDHVSLEKLADLMDDDWVSGNADASYEFTGSGRSVAGILSSSSAELKISARDCLLPHITLGGDDPLHTERFDTNLLFSNGRFQIKQGTFENIEGKYEINGTVSLNRDMSLKLTRTDGPEFNINGTLAVPRIAASKSPIARVSQRP